MINELDDVVLTCDLPEHGLSAGDIGTAVLVHRHGRARASARSGLRGRIPVPGLRDDCGRHPDGQSSPRHVGWLTGRHYFGPTRPSSIGQNEGARLFWP